MCFHNMFVVSNLLICEKLPIQESCIKMFSSLLRGLSVLKEFKLAELTCHSHYYGQPFTVIGNLDWRHH